MSDQPMRNYPQTWMPFFHPYSIASYSDPTFRLKITLKLQALSCLELAARLLPESFNLGALASKSVISQLKKSFW